jgi:hypothetical protein
MWLEFRWWGVIVHLNREAACWIAQSHPERERLLESIPEPWRTIVRGAIAAYKWAFGNSTGTDGLDLHFNWFGFIHWWGPTGASQPCGFPVTA